MKSFYEDEQIMQNPVQITGLNGNKITVNDEFGDSFYFYLSPGESADMFDIGGVLDGDSVQLIRGGSTYE